ncbi:MAG: hypothetical protein ICV86_08825 [Microcoleus sp. T3-bin5]|nr:hypothetical protein [Microcoleus sp. T3-bin5]
MTVDCSRRQQSTLIYYSDANGFDITPHPPPIEASGEIRARLVAASGKIAIVLPAQP